MPEKEVLAHFICQARQRLNQSQEEFAYNCGISVDNLSLRERGKSNPSLLTLQKIAAYTGSTVADMLTVKTSGKDT